MRRGRWILVFLAILMVGILSVLIFMPSKEDQPEPETEMTERLVETTEALPESTAVTTESESTEPLTEAYQSPIDFEELWQSNEDVIAWIKIPGTNIDYPIVQTTDNDYYLHRDLYGNDSNHGTIYLDYESNQDFNGYNHILYGHNMKDGSMFKDVVKYKDPDFFKEHQRFEIYTPERTIYLKAVSCYYDQAKAIARKTSFSDPEAFQQYLKEMLSPCEYAEIPEYPVDKLFILITCSYEIEDARTYLYAVEVDQDGTMIYSDGEDTKDHNE